MPVSLPLQAQITETNSFTNLNQAIPDGNASGLHAVRAITSAIAHLSSARLNLRVTGEFNGAKQQAGPWLGMPGLPGGVPARCQSFMGNGCQRLADY